MPGYRRAYKTARRLYPLMLAAYRRWDSLSDEEKQRYLEQAKRYSTLAAKEYVTAEQNDAAQSDAAAATATVAAGQAAVDQAQLNLQYTTVRAAFNGIVSKKTVEPGQVLQPGQPLMALINLDDLWVTANYKETQLRQMRPGDLRCVTPARP